MNPTPNTDPAKFPHVRNASVAKRLAKAFFGPRGRIWQRAEEIPAKLVEGTESFSLQQPLRVPVILIGTESSMGEKLVYGQGPDFTAAFQDAIDRQAAAKANVTTTATPASATVTAP